MQRQRGGATRKGANKLQSLNCETVHSWSEQVCVMTIMNMIRNKYITNENSSCAIFDMLGNDK